MDLSISSVVNCGSDTAKHLRELGSQEQCNPGGILQYLSMCCALLLVLNSLILELPGLSQPLLRSSFSNTLHILLGERTGLWLVFLNEIEGLVFSKKLSYMFFCLETDWSIFEFSQQSTALGRRGIFKTRTGG